MECIWFVYAEFLRRMLDDVKNELNLHTIRYTKESQVSGFPINLYYLPESKGYAPQGHQLNKIDVVNVLQQRDFEEVFEQIMEGRNSQLQDYFRYIALSQQMSLPPSGWECKNVIHRNH